MEMECSYCNTNVTRFDAASSPMRRSGDHLSIGQGLKLEKLGCSN